MTRAYDLACGEGQQRKGQKLIESICRKHPHLRGAFEFKSEEEVYRCRSGIWAVIYAMSDAEFDKALSS